MTGPEDDFLEVRPIGELRARDRCRALGLVRKTEVITYGEGHALEVLLEDETGTLELVFAGRRTIAGVVPGTRLVVDGRVVERDGAVVVYNPRYRLVAGEEGNR